MGEKNIDPDGNVKKESAAKKDHKKKESKEKGNPLKNWFLDIKGEYGKIIWPKRADLIKETITVIFTSALVGVVILCMDAVFAQGYNLFIKYLGKG